MLMRYHSGLGIGHTYSHQHCQSLDGHGSPGTSISEECEEPGSGNNLQEDEHVILSLNDDPGSQCETDVSDSGGDGWQDEDGDTERSDASKSDDEEYLGMHEMHYAR